MLTAEFVREILDYNPDTGVFTWKVARSRTRVGSVAGYFQASRGYWLIKIYGRLYPAHRLAWLYVHGTWPADQLDHRNRQRADNRIENLREATQTQNNANQGLASHNTSGAKGIYFRKTSGRWFAEIRCGGTYRWLGSFATPEEAQKSYAAAASEVFGEYAHAAQQQQKRLRNCA